MRWFEIDIYEKKNWYLINKLKLCAISDVPVWSKLVTGRVPQPPELFQIIDNHLQMLFPEKDSLDMTFTK